MEGKKFTPVNWGIKKTKQKPNNSLPGLLKYPSPQPGHGFPAD